MKSNTGVRFGFVWPPAYRSHNISLLDEGLLAGVPSHHPSGCATFFLDHPEERLAHLIQHLDANHASGAHEPGRGLSKRARFPAALCSNGAPDPHILRPRQMRNQLHKIEEHVSACVQLADEASVPARAQRQGHLRIAPGVLRSSGVTAMGENPVVGLDCRKAKTLDQFRRHHVAQRNFIDQHQQANLLVSVVRRGPPVGTAAVTAATPAPKSTPRSS